MILGGVVSEGAVLDGYPLPFRAILGKAHDNGADTCGRHPL